MIYIIILYQTSIVIINFRLIIIIYGRPGIVTQNLMCIYIYIHTDRATVTVTVTII